MYLHHLELGKAEIAPKAHLKPNFRCSTNMSYKLLSAIAFPAEAIHVACLSDKTCLKHILLTYKGFRQAKGTGCNWCQRGAK